MSGTGLSVEPVAAPVVVVTSAGTTGVPLVLRTVVDGPTHEAAPAEVTTTASATSLCIMAVVILVPGMATVAPDGADLAVHVAADVSGDPREPELEASDRTHVTAHVVSHSKLPFALVGLAHQVGEGLFGLELAGERRDPGRYGGGRGVVEHGEGT